MRQGDSLCLALSQLTWWEQTLKNGFIPTPLVAALQMRMMMMMMLYSSVPSMCCVPAVTLSYAGPVEILSEDVKPTSSS